MERYDYILIGTGQATGTILTPLLQKNLKIAVIESSKPGGTCVNWGCTPTKTLVASARDAHMIRRASDFGIEVDSFKINFARIMERVNAIRNPSNDGFKSWLESNLDYYEGSASFVDNNTIKVGEHSLSADKIIIHTGTRSRIPSIEGINETPWLDNRGILALTELPEHLIVLY